MATTTIFQDLLVDHVEFYVADLAAQTDWFTGGLGFGVYADTEPDASGKAPATRSAGVGRGEIRLVLTEPLTADHPAAAYVARHGDGVADIALRVADAAAAYREAVRRGARPVSPPARHGDVVTATIMGFGDVAHTFVQRLGGADARTLPGLRPLVGPLVGAGTAFDSGLAEVDHFAVCVEAGQIEAVTRFYQKILDFDMIFSERIAVGSQAMTTQVVQSRSGAVTFTLVEPDVSLDAGHIDEFLKEHGGAGVQHMALTTHDIVTAVDRLGHAGVEFLSTPDAYYDLLSERARSARHPVGELRRIGVLVDEDHDGHLYQIFTRSVHPRGTFFLEVIERLGARSFGSGNIAALYQAVELQRGDSVVA
ncbi:4-hydroxyphenylpyruvate dioxygenase [Sphaerimonospora thailandensis]|uniref:4-hydroxyphenylpyruvate dioxygenase n=1 Tax=Sphaerimonospora thailandensis TaxID=795644 RepID=A0A8J3R4V9_9ACTN|nr:4-hydroxyphenylpyruvate dioxygenase [Sphaerimonospora thailandensis]GIH67785.1 4-hydroxyphenylpyruvate dioxygenase [Sphaerimonospora thailandensis]